MNLKIGVLSPQGGFEGHHKMVNDAYGDAIPVQTAAELPALEGLIISGHDAASLLQSFRATNLFDELRKFGQQKPIFASGAAACLVAREVTSPTQESLDLMNIGIACDGYEHQIDNLTEMLHHEFDDESGALHAVFLRPPMIRWVGPETTVFAKYHNDPVLIEQGLHMASTFHLELSLDRRVYFHFVDKVRENYWKLRLA